MTGLLIAATAFAQEAGASVSQPSGLMRIVAHPMTMMAVIFAIIYLLIMRPQQKKQKQQQQSCPEPQQLQALWRHLSILQLQLPLRTRFSKATCQQWKTALRQTAEASKSLRNS